MEPLTRISYRDKNTGQPRTQPTLRRESLVDYENYLRPWGRAHVSALHSPGVALGLEVRAIHDSAKLRVLPGVAVNAQGDHIVLATKGSAIFRGARIPVKEPSDETEGGAVLATAGLDGPHLLTIAWHETLDDEVVFDGEQRKVAEHTPRLILRPPTITVDRTEVVLAEMTIAGGAIRGLGIGARRQCAGQLTLTRPAPSASGSDLTAGSAVAAQVRPIGGGLELAVAAPGSLTVAADGLTVRGRTDATALTLDSGTGNLGIGTAAPRTRLDVAGSVAVDGRIGVGTAHPRARLEVQGDLLVAGPLSVNGALSVTGGALVVDKITPTGTLEVAKGLKVTGGSLEAQQGLKVTGGSLEAQQGLRVAGPLSVNGALSVTGGALVVDKITPTGTLEVAKGLKVTGGRLEAQQGVHVTGPVTASDTFNVIGALALEGHGLQGLGTIGVVAKGSFLAGQFSGNVEVTGSLVQAGALARIDHPLDPENRYLAHSFVESPEMKNIYDGVVTLDAGGEATVELPAWFEALNETCRYQLTPIGAPGPRLHISRQLAGNRFTIAGGDRQMEVCWQVTGVRRDVWALANPLVVEEDKALEERGYYLHPEAHGKSADKALPRFTSPSSRGSMTDRTRNKGSPVVVVGR